MDAIRKAKEQDIIELCAIEKACFKYDILSKKSLRNFINHKHHLFLVAEHDKKIAGYLITLINSRHKMARHYSLAVLPQYRGQSIGKKLLLASESYITSKQGIKLEVHVENKPAQDLYRSMGFSFSKIKIGYYEDSSNAIEMIKFFN